ncbi:peptidylprolyl isomerase [Novosphingobium sp. Rr 2-17]|uniref:peptidylprolyl isomerase n=1 Tax=Novosphingobium sp. Rr 2-17 TaxID=555793 RepID=UPI0002697E9E|nr:peptidylprolyl isomerase [Novosphingobium sp. Rr 2-17]EIZ79564.1 peptidylprolyl isomerase [Novosphingobium sp. Rr 2-17]
MKFRLPLTALMLGAALLAGPAVAKTKVPVAPAPTALPYVIDTDPTHEPENVLLLDLSDGGRVAIRLMPQWAPHHVERIKTLVAQGFYNGVIFHRVIEGFMAQTGDPTGTGEGGSKLPDLQAEFNAMPHLRGTVSMARTNDPNSANSQFFIVFYPRFALDRKYTVFGRVIGGMQYVDAIQRGEPPANPTKVLQASLASDGKAPPVVTAATVAPVAPAAAPAATPAAPPTPARPSPTAAGPKPN